MAIALSLADLPSYVDDCECPPTLIQLVQLLIFVVESGSRTVDTSLQNRFSSIQHNHTFSARHLVQVRSATSLFQSFDKAATHQRCREQQHRCSRRLRHIPYRSSSHFVLKGMRKLPPLTEACRTCRPMYYSRLVRTAVSCRTSLLDDDSARSRRSR